MSARHAVVLVLVAAGSAVALKAVGELRLIDERASSTSSLFDVTSPDASSVRQFRADNIGRGPLQIDDVFIFGDDAGVFSESVDGGVALNSGSGRPFGVTFSPNGRVGAFSARLVVDSTTDVRTRTSMNLCALSQPDGGPGVAAECDAPAPPVLENPPAMRGCSSSGGPLELLAALGLVRLLASRRARA